MALYRLFLRDRDIPFEPALFLSFFSVSAFPHRKEHHRVCKFAFSLNAEPVEVKGVAVFTAGYRFHESHVEFRPKPADDIRAFGQLIAWEKTHLLQRFEIRNEFFKTARAKQTYFLLVQRNNQQAISQDPVLRLLGQYEFFVSSTLKKKAARQV